MDMLHSQLEPLYYTVTEVRDNTRVLHPSPPGAYITSLSCWESWYKQKLYTRHSLSVAEELALTHDTVECQALQSSLSNARHSGRWHWPMAKSNVRLIPLAGLDLWHFNVLDGVHIDSGPSQMQGIPVFMKSCQWHVIWPRYQALLQVT